jgi:WD40 repeat protein
VSTLLRAAPLLVGLAFASAAGGFCAGGTEAGPGRQAAGGGTAGQADTATVGQQPAAPPPAPDCPPGARALVETGHRGEVLAMEYDEARGLLFSAGEDGTVRVWDAVRRILLHRLQATHLAAAMLAVSPAQAPRVAVLETDSTRTWAISVWDWEQEKRLFRVELAENPLFLRYSGGGELLAWGESRWDSLRLVRADTGDPVRLGSADLGIVGFAEIGAAGRTIMTYQLTGRIAYWDLASGALLREMASVPYLASVRMSRDRRFLAGSTGREIVVVDALSGAVRARSPLSGVLALDFSPAGDTIAAAAGPGAAPGLSLWSLGVDSLARIETAPTLRSAVVVRFAGDGVLAAARGGEIQSVSLRGGEPEVLARDELDRVTGIDVAAGRVALATASRVWVFSSRLLVGRSAAGSASLQGSEALVDAVSVPNPHGAASGVSFLSPERILVWDRGDSPGPAVVLDIPSRTFVRAGGEGRGPLLESEVQRPGSPLAGQLLSLERGGVVSVSDTLTGLVRFSTRLPGVSTVTAAGPGELVGGRNAAVASEGSLLRINMETGETVPVPTRAVFIYDMLFEPASGALYSLGVDAAGFTSLLRHAGRGFETETAIDRVDWEDLFATLAFDPSTGLLFSSLGSARIGVWDAGSLALMKFPDTGRVPRTLRARDGLLFALNRDSTVGVWDENRGENLGEISLFADGEWCFLFPGGRYAASRDGARHVGVRIDGQSAADPAGCRVR